MTDTFAARFEAAWASPTAEGLAALLTEDVVLKQPHLPPIRGKAAAIEEFTRLFTWIPGTHSVVLSSVQLGDLVFIQHVLKFPVGDAMISIPAVDRFVLREGLGVERIVYFDQMKLIAGVLRHPSLWPGYFKYRYGG